MSQEQQPLLAVNNIHSYYGNIHALQGISLNIFEGEIVTLIGANGAGKSTTIRTVSGIMHPREGTIHFDGQPIHQLPAHSLVSKGISQSPEGRRIFPRLSVRDNLAMGAYKRNDRRAIRQDIDRIYDLFPRLKERTKQYGGTLSGGEQQMLAIGRALMARPRLLLLDEPSMGLAPVLVEQIFEIIVRINKEEGTTILLVEQNALMALEVAKRGYVLQTGTVVLHDNADALMHNEMVRRVYLGEE
ncbi:MAG: ABC transporter ATP-binding protein [Chloroflexi bacterium]|nr:ABC transporter ATP-binding protein [Chloroflexota bacterium]NOG63422.1 ABC transporter ATP-binding protein [Chloroflexota bacterium]